MHAKNFGLFCLIIGLSGGLKAQLNERFEVTTSPSAFEMQNKTHQPISCEAAEKLVLDGCSLEAAIIFSDLIVHYHFLKDTSNLDKACEGLYRTQLLTHVDSKYSSKLSLCRPEIIASLSEKGDWEPMFVTRPIFESNDQWLSSATPGVAYKVTVQFDIDEWGKPYNFDFNADDKFLLRYPIIERLKNIRYLPAFQNGEAVKRSKNYIEVVYCLDRGTSCIY